MDNIEENNDSNVFLNILERAQQADLTEVVNFNCVGVGRDEKQQPCIYVIPYLALKIQNSTYSSSQILDDMLLLFFKIAESISHQPYSIVYGHSVFSLYSQVKMLRKVYKMLPRRYKKNLTDLYIVHPTPRVHFFFQMSKLFIGRHVTRIVKFIPSIAQFQRVVSPTALKLPPNFLLWEDTERGLLGRRGEVPPLIELFDKDLGAPSFVVRCVEYLRENGMEREGIFRVAGDQVALEVGRNRFYEGCEHVLIGGATHTFHGQLKRRVEEESSSDADTDADLLVENVDEVAQLLKAFLRELPEPVVTTNAYHAIIKAVSHSKTESAAEVGADGLVDIIESSLERTMPTEHFLTLGYILRFLAEVAAGGHINKMGPDNISVIFAPTLMRVEMEDPMKAMSDIKICQKILRGLLLKYMERSMTSALSDIKFGRALR